MERVVQDGLEAKQRLNADGVSRRSFMAAFAAMGLGATAVPSTLWARLQEQQANELTASMINDGCS